MRLPTSQPRSPDIWLSARFLRSQESLGPQLQLRLTGEVHDFVRAFRADFKTASRGYDRVATSLPGGAGQLLELEVSGKDRIVAHWAAPRLTLLDVGDHETVPRYDRRWIKDDLRTSTLAPEGYWPDGPSILRFFGNASATTWDHHPHEDDVDWLYYLGSAQTAVTSRIRQKLVRSSILDQGRVFVVGGPGTGKTSVLLTLLLSLTREGFRVGIHLSDPVAALIDAGGFLVSAFRVPEGGTREPLDVILYDDPGTATQIQMAMDESFGVARLVVVAFDPCQMNDDLLDDQYERLVASNGVSEQRLRECYRQKAKVGHAAKRVMDRVAESSPFKAEGKVEWFMEHHERVYAISNELRFVNGGGLERVYPDATADSVKEALGMMRRRPRWKVAAPPVLLVVDEHTSTTGWQWGKWLADTQYTRVGLADIEGVKGLEYQWVLIVIRQSLFEELESGFVGSSQRVYNARRLLRIPFTRARDGLFTFVLPDDLKPARWDPYAVR